MNTLKPFVCLAAGLLLTVTPPANAADPATATPDKPDPAQLKYGMYVHFGTATFAGPGAKSRWPAERFAFTELDLRAWARTAKAAGMTFVVLTAKHESGFCLWDSQDYEYDVGSSPVKVDIVGDFIAACKAEGLLPGIHYSIPDDYNEGVVRYKGEVPPPYFGVIKRQMAELHSKYPELRVQILDLSERLSPAQFEELRRIVERLNPACLVWGTTNGGYGLHHVPATINKGWMWSANGQLNSVQRLFEQYQQCQTDGKAFVLNVGPDRAGRIPADQAAALMEMKKLIAATPGGNAPLKAISPTPSAAERLKQLKSLYDQGLISKEDYDREVKEILDPL
jgi:alpha-L-fucosidase